MCVFSEMVFASDSSLNGFGIYIYIYDMYGKFCRHDSHVINQLCILLHMHKYTADNYII